MLKKIFPLLFVVTSNFLMAQLMLLSHPDIQSEGNFYVKGSKLYSDAIVINFSENIVNLPPGSKYAKISDLNPNYTRLNAMLTDLDSKFGLLKIVKQVPNAEWGKTECRNNITNTFVNIHDYSQLLTLKFNSPVPLDSVINIFKVLPEIEFVHEPISFIHFVEPNDPLFQNGSQWNLDVVDAEYAWNITRGVSNVAIGIVDDGINVSHEDLESKIAGGNGIDGQHGTWVSGVAAASTDNSIGVASLGWNLSLYTYGGYEHFGDESYAVQGIISATQTSDIINMSWMTGRYIIDEFDLLEICPECPSPHKWAPPSNPSVIVPKSYPEISSAISDAVNQGVVCVASAGNSSKNYGPEPELCDPMWVPYINYPAAYSNVIAVSGTKLYNSIEQFVDGWNYGYFVDVSGPGKYIWTTDRSGGYANTSGTSFSSPLVSALCGLLRSINPYFTVNEVKTILFNTAEKVDSNRFPYDPQTGWNDHLGYGRINAHEALLSGLDYLALENKSTTSWATYSNNARHLAKDSGYLHEIFSSGGEIFFRRSNNDGSTWQVTKRLSEGNGSNSRSALTAYYDHSLHVVWQHKVGTNLWDIYYTYSTNYGGSWSTPSKIAQNVQTSYYQNNGPQPVISDCFVDEMYMQLMTVYTSSNGLYYTTKMSASGSWPTPTNISGSYNNYIRFPSLSGNIGYFALVYDTRYYGVYSRTFNGSWTSAIKFSDSAPYYERETCVAQEKQGGDMLATWVARPVSYQPYSTYFRRGYYNNTWSNFTAEFYESGIDYRRPSITYFDANYSNEYGIAILYHSSDYRIMMQKYYDQFGTWTENQVASNGGEANITGYAYDDPKYFWTDNSASPYQVKLSSNYLPKSSTPTEYKNVLARRAVISNEKDQSSQCLEVSDYIVKTKSGDSYRIAFQSYPDDTVKLDLNTVWNYMDTEPVKLPSDATELVYTKNIYTTLPNDSSAKTFESSFSGAGFQLAVADARTKAQITVLDNNDKSSEVHADISSLAGKEIILYPSLSITGVNESELMFGLVNIYYQPKEKAETLQKITFSEEIKPFPTTVQLNPNYPNPFNPTTRISYSIPENGSVKLNIYDLQGRLIKTIINSSQEGGNHVVSWDGTNQSGYSVSSGVYIYQLRFNNVIKTRKLLLMR